MPSLKNLYISLVIAALVLSVGSANAASTSSIAVAEVAAKAGCANVKLSLSINDAFLKLDQKLQTKEKTTAAITSENRALASALKSFQSAAKSDKKWKATAENLNTVIHTEVAGEFTKAFNALLATCADVSKEVKK